MKHRTSRIRQVYVGRRFSVSNAAIDFSSLVHLYRIRCKVCTSYIPQRRLSYYIIELWALLHFIMPSLFDSHDEFNEWFSKDIENAAENKGSKLNEHQLRRLHMILKPFMLRRIKKHVQNELSEKVFNFSSLSAKSHIVDRLRSMSTLT